MTQTNLFAHTAVVAGSDGIGQAEQNLRHRLVANYFRTLLEAEQFPQSILLYASGVKLVASDSPCLEALRGLAAAGVPIIACRTCLEFYALADEIAVGEIGNMLRIVEAQSAAQKVVTL